MNLNRSPLLQVIDLNVDFKSEGKTTAILKEISFVLEKGETLGIVGESGSGKTITVQSILNLIPTPPLSGISGKILFKDTDLLNCSQTQLRSIRGKEIAYIFQEPMTALNPVLSIGDQIMEMIRTHESTGRKSAFQKAVSLLEEVGIPSPEQRMKNFPHELSGGMRQRAMIAMALSCNPEILLADEPTTALDVTIQAQVLELFKELKQTRGTSIIFVTHDLGVIAEIADKLMVLRQGMIIEEGPLDQIFKSPQQEYTRELISLLGGE